jgi:hypothetical protein
MHNKSVGTDCTGSHIFPDILYDRGTHFIAVEVDEHQHRASSYKCEQQRMLNVIANLGLSCVFIRYNPDHKDNYSRM